MTARRPCQRRYPLQPCERGAAYTRIPAGHPSQRREAGPGMTAATRALFGLAGVLSEALRIPGRMR